MLRAKEDATERFGTPGFNPPPPLFVAEPIPIFRDELHRIEYYKEEKRRWMEGFGGLTGPHYFYLTQCHLKDVDGNITKPTWRQCDQEVFERVDSCMKRGKGLMVFKRREYGLTSVFGGGLPFWFALCYPGILINMTSKDRDGFVRMFDDKVMTTYSNMDEYIMNPIPLNKNNTKDQAFLKLGIKKIGEDGILRMHETTLNLVETSENPKSVNKFSAGRAKYTFIDESALHSRIADLLRSMEATMMSGANKVGFLCLGGTIEASLSNQQIADYQQLMKDVEVFDIETMFIPCYKGLITKNGWDDVEAGKKWYYENVEKKSKSSNSADLRAFKMNYPIDENDVFQYGTGGMLEDDVCEMVQLRLAELEKNGTPEAKVKYVETPDGISVIPDKSQGEEGFYELEPPLQGLQYYLAIDSIATAKRDGTDDGSKIACTVYKGFDPNGKSYEPVSTYFHRPNTIEEGYRNIKKQFRRYNIYGGVKDINYEATAATGDHLGTFLEKEGLYKYAARRKDLSGKGWIDTKKRGVTINDHTMEWMVNQANIFLRKYVYNFRSKVVLHQLLYPANRNADIRSAFFVFLASIPNFDKPPVKKLAPQFRTVVELVRNAQGQTIYKTTQVPIEVPYEEMTSDMALTKFESYEASLKKKYGEYAYQKATEDEKEKYRVLKNTGQ